MVAQGFSAGTKFAPDHATITPKPEAGGVNIEGKGNVAMTRALLVSILLLSAQALSQQQVPSNAPGDEISVRISTKSRRFKLGQHIIVQVEIWNQSTRDLFISKAIDDHTCDGLAALELSVYKGNEPIGPSMGIASDCFKRSSDPPLVVQLSKYWIALPPHHFYGKQVTIDASWSAGFKSGKYRIQGKYKSQGFLAQNINNPLLHYAQELQQLPFPAWVGEVATNPIWIELTSIPNRRNC